MARDDDSARTADDFVYERLLTRGEGKAVRLETPGDNPLPRLIQRIADSVLTYMRTNIADPQGEKRSALGPQCRGVSHT